MQIRYQAKNSTSCSPTPSTDISHGIRISVHFSPTLNFANWPPVYRSQPNSLTSLTAGSTGTSHRTCATDQLPTLRILFRDTVQVVSKTAPTNIKWQNVYSMTIHSADAPRH